MNKQKVLFLCTGNSARSQMAEALLRKHSDDQFEAYSAGLEPKAVNPYTVRVMDEVGIDIRNQSAKSVREFMGKVQFDHTVIVCRRAEPNCPTIYPDSRYYQRWLFDDPAAVVGDDTEKLARFRDVRDQIDERLKLWIAETLE
ncbi:MAG: arsenate reductase ArsC [Chloroflexota bacterium]